MALGTPGSGKTAAWLTSEEGEGRRWGSADAGPWRGSSTTEAAGGGAWSSSGDRVARPWDRARRSRAWEEEGHGAAVVTQRQGRGAAGGEMARRRRGSAVGGVAGAGSGGRGAKATRSCGREGRGGATARRGWTEPVEMLVFEESKNVEILGGASIKEIGSCGSGTCGGWNCVSTSPLGFFGILGIYRAKRRCGRPLRWAQPNRARLGPKVPRYSRRLFAWISYWFDNLGSLLK
ncbi:hypothetical protein TRIUR3_32857 [Triticum urartu]|uniref:Uncharacterized protein n=1 Tax=Triticum urartu TaxID=4572 RepID=M7YYJ8_TRIUA|nr:hypothetical protein TRIUR3_32857 [Triticum urartu]